MTTTTSDGIFIEGRWSTPSTGERIEVINPSTAQPIGSVAAATTADVDAAVGAGARAFTSWSTTDVAERAGYMRALADALAARADQLALTVSRQNGMPLAVSSSIEAGFPSLLLRFYADLIESAPAVETRAGLLGGKVDVIRRPMGVVAAIVPWNYPQTLAMSKIAPAIAAGNTVVLKPSPETVLDSVLLAEAIVAAGLPAGVINIVPGGREVGEYLIGHPGISRVAFTGSTDSGRAVARRCADLLRPVSLELGGKSAAIILDDADLAANAEGLFAATLLNNGQTCFISTRVLAPRSRYDETVELLTSLATGAVVGDATDPSTMIGPLVSPRQRERVEGFIERGRAAGARLTAGGGRPDLPGWFVEPTIFAEVDNSAEIARQEIFGPVLTVIAYDDEDQAVAIANDSDYGLGGTVWSADPQHAHAIARRIDTGTIGINGYAPDPAAPFGGTKLSGLGREFGPEALAEYVELQTIYRPGA